jgi:hypothetical protein
VSLWVESIRYDATMGRTESARWRQQTVQTRLSLERREWRGPSLRGGGSRQSHSAGLVAPNRTLEVEVTESAQWRQQTVLFRPVRVFTPSEALSPFRFPFVRSSITLVFAAVFLLHVLFLRSCRRCSFRSCFYEILSFCCATVEIHLFH